MSLAEKLQSAGCQPEVPVAEGIEVASHQVHLEACTQDQQVSKADSAGSAGGPCHCMIDHAQPSDDKRLGHPRVEGINPCDK